MGHVWIIGECVLDKFYKVNHLPKRGECAFAGSFKECVGGSAVNIALMLSNFLVRPMLVTYLGANISKSVLSKVFKPQKIRLFHLTGTEGPSSENKIYYNHTTYYSFFTMGSEGNLDYTNSSFLRNIQDGDLVVLAGSHYKSIRNLYKHLVTSKLLRVIFNPSYSIYHYDVKSLKKLISYANYVCLNKEEMDYLYMSFGIDIDKLVNKKRIVILTLGHKGVEIFSRKNRIIIKGRKVSGIKNAIGAGDGLISGLIYALLNEWSLQTCGEIGQVCTSFVLKSECAHASFRKQEIFRCYKSWFKKDIEKLKKLEGK